MIINKCFFLIIKGDAKMGKEKGKFTKKILHLGHLLLEFLRNVVKAIGKPDKPHQSKVQHKSSADKALQKTGSESVKATAKTAGKTVGNAVKGFTKSIAAKSGSMLGTSSLGGLGSAATGATGLAGAVISVKTLAVAMVAASVFLGGLGTYSYVTEQNPLTVVETLFNTGGSPGSTNQNPNNPVTPENLENSQSGGGQADQDSQGPDSTTDSPVYTASDSQIPSGTGSYQSTQADNNQGNEDGWSGGGDDDQDSDTGDGTIDYEIP